MPAFKLAIKNLLGAGLSTWLNVFVLSTSFIIIIWTRGLLKGWERQAKSDTISWEIAGGQYWHKNYNPYDPLTISESHDLVPEKSSHFNSIDEIVPILISQGTIYPEGRMLPVIIKGIPPDQKLLEIPTPLLSYDNETDVPAIIGRSMAESSKLEEGDYVTLRWRDKNGTYDAIRISIKGIFDTSVPGVDVGQIWIPIEKLREMLLLPGEATLLVTKSELNITLESESWIFKSPESLLSDLDKMIRSQSAMGVIMWGILLMMAMLAVFDSQVLSIFKRRKEIGTYVALGMTQAQVVGLFTLEGTLHSVLAVFVAAVYGIPLLAYQAVNGISIPLDSSDFGISMTEKLYPVYSPGLIAGTVLFVIITTIIVSYWPSRKIAKLKPTEALRGKVQ